jgi:3-hydroxybutyryl-CoA dehydratase
MRSFAVGDRFVHERTFTEADVVAFLAISEDRGRHHAEAAPDGRRLVHGLLTATIPTKIGGDLDYLAREMRFEFLRPVYTGDTVRCVVTVDEVDADPRRTRLVMSGTCHDQHGDEVMRFFTRGVIRGVIRA